MEIYKNYLRLISKRYILLFIIIYLSIIFIIDSNSSMHFIDVILTNNYVSLVLNTYFYIFIYHIINILNDMRYYTITRLHYKHCKNSIYTFIFLLTFLFLVTFYTMMILKFGFAYEMHMKNMIFNLHLYINEYVVFVLYTFIYFIEAFVLLQQFDKKKSIKYIGVVFTINLIIRYVVFL